MTAPYAPQVRPAGDNPDRFEVVADQLAHSAVATAILASGLSRQIEKGLLSREEILDVLDVIAEESAAAHALAAELFSSSA